MYYYYYYYYHTTTFAPKKRERQIDKDTDRCGWLCVSKQEQAIACVSLVIQTGGGSMASAVVPVVVVCDMTSSCGRVGPGPPTAPVRGAYLLLCWARRLVVKSDITSLATTTIANNAIIPSVIFVTKIKTRTRIIGRRFQRTRTRIIVIQKIKTK